MKLSLRSLVPALLVLAAVMCWSVWMVAQKLTAMIHAGLAESRQLRVAATNTCAADASGTHFTGCSSIL